MKQVTIILPVFNGVRYVRLCLDALVEHTDPANYRLILIDDCSDNYTASFLREASERFGDCVLLRNDKNLGFLRSCNQAWTQCKTPFILLLNSDVLVSPGWLTRLLHCAETDPKIASVNPLTNHASNIALPLPQGCNHLGLDRQLAKRPVCCHDIVTGVGFCMLLRRSAVGEILFDEIYGKGYCEESDLCMRLTTSGWRVVSSENVYVHHRGHASFADRDARYTANRRIFDRRWDAEYRRQFQSFRRRNPLSEIRNELSHPIQVWPRKYLREEGKGICGRKSRAGWRETARAALRMVRHPKMIAFPRVSTTLVNSYSRKEAPSITYVVQDMSLSGGVFSIIQLVNELILQGFDARIATRCVDPGVRNLSWLLTEPMVFRSPTQLIKELPPTDIAVATIWTTASWVRVLGDTGRAKMLAYFLQDYEPWFIPETDKATRNRIINEYGLIQNRIVKSNWLANKLAEHGYSTTKILLGMDLDQFYPRDRTSSVPIILAMARPNTPRRGFSTTVAALAIVKSSLPEIRIIFFGSEDLRQADIPFEFESAGCITNQNQLAQLYSDANVFLETSTFQGFGRCALEAMACGTPVVLTPEGGITEYAKPNQNCLAIPPNSPHDTATAVLRLLSDDDLRQRLSTVGLETAQNFCHRREAKQTADYFLNLAGKSMLSETNK